MPGLTVAAWPLTVTVTAVASVTVPVTERLDAPVNVPSVGSPIVTTGATRSTVSVRVSVAVWPVESVAVTVI